MRPNHNPQKDIKIGDYTISTGNTVHNTNEKLYQVTSSSVIGKKFAAREIGAEKY